MPSGTLTRPQWLPKPSMYSSGFEAAADPQVLGREQIVAPRRMHAQQVDEGHRRGDGQLDVEPDPDQHGKQLPNGLFERSEKFAMRPAGGTCDGTDRACRKPRRPAGSRRRPTRASGLGRFAAPAEARKVDAGDLDMSTFAAKIDRFVRWFFNVSPTTTSIEPRPPRRRASSSPRRTRSASPRTGAMRVRPIGAQPARRARPGPHARTARRMHATARPCAARCCARA